MTDFKGDACYCKPWVVKKYYYNCGNDIEYIIEVDDEDNSVYKISRRDRYGDEIDNNDELYYRNEDNYTFFSIDINSDNVDEMNRKLKDEFEENEMEFNIDDDGWRLFATYGEYFEFN